MSQHTVLVIGGAGMIGCRLVSALSAAGHSVIVPTRRTSFASQRARELIMLPRVELVQADVHDALTLAGLVGRADVVVNLVGVLHGGRGSPYGAGFRRAHVDLVHQIVQACQRAGVRRLLHMSALGADSQGPSMYQRSKGDGERLVRDSGLDWTIFRPSVVFAPEDNFVNLFASLQRLAPFVPLAGAGTRFQPVYAGDVVDAMLRSIDLHAASGKTYALGGPQVYTLAQIVRFAGAAAGRPRPVLPMPRVFGYLQALLFECLPGAPLMSRDNLDSMRVDNVLSGPMAAELDLHPHSLEAVMGPTLRPRR